MVHGRTEELVTYVMTPEDAASLDNFLAAAARRGPGGYPGPGELRSMLRRAADGPPQECDECHAVKPADVTHWRVDDDSGLVGYCRDCWTG